MSHNTPFLNATFLHTGLRRLAPMLIAAALLSTACTTTPSNDLGAGAPTGAVVEIPNPPTLPSTTTTTATPVEGEPENSAPTTATAPDPEPAPADDQAAGSDTTDPDTTDPDTTGGTNDTNADGSSNERPPGRTPGGFTVPGRVLEPTRSSDQVAATHDLDDPITLVYEGDGGPLTDIRVEIGQVGVGSSLTVDYGDGTIVDLGVVTTGQHLMIRHVFEQTLTLQNQEVVATVTEPNGTDHQDRLTFGTQARFALSFSPIRVTALNSCDTFGKGDFRLTWEHSGSQSVATFELGAGESFTVDAFGGAAGVVVYGQELPFKLKLAEEDPWGAWFFAPWKWDFPIEFDGSTVSSGIRPVSEIGDHSYTATSSSSSGLGLPGDDDCATKATFDVVLDMLDD